MKGWSVGFPTTLRLIKPEKDNRVKFKKREVSSQRDPVYQNTARTAEHPKQIQHTILQRWENGWPPPIDTPSEVSQMFSFMDYGVFLATALFALLFLIVCEEWRWANTESNLKTQMFDRKLNTVATACLPFPETRVYLVLNSQEHTGAGRQPAIDVNK